MRAPCASPSAAPAAIVPAALALAFRAAAADTRFAGARLTIEPAGAQPLCRLRHRVRLRGPDRQCSPAARPVARSSPATASSCAPSR
ncbi:MAG: hypothetical protein U0802_25835 [Candidatus Binatia bacterium]